MEILISVLIPILSVIESNNNPKAIGDNGKAVGVLQIHKVMVDDVNRIIRLHYTKTTHFYGYNDRRSVKKSREMVRIYLRHYAPKHIKGLSNKEALVLMGRM